MRQRILRRAPLLVSLQGGLGNQLFQIVFGVQVERKFARPILFDTSFFGDPGQATRRLLEVDLAKVGYRQVQLPWLISMGLRLLPRPLRIKERAGSVLSMEDIRASTISVVGYHQCYSLATQSHDIVQDILKVHCPPSRSDGSTVAVHIRLGDYLERHTTGDFHGVTHPRWSLDQARALAEQLGGARVRIFTDSPSRLHEFLIPEQLDVAEVDSSQTAWEVLSSMSSADGIVMSNSSLSWWAAFIANEIDGRDVPVVMPTPWFRHPSTADTALAAPYWRIEPRTFLEVP